MITHFIKSCDCGLALSKFFSCWLGFHCSSLAKTKQSSAKLFFTCYCNFMHIFGVQCLLLASSMVGLNGSNVRHSVGCSVGTVHHVGQSETSQRLMDRFGHSCLTQAELKWLWQLFSWITSGFSKADMITVVWSGKKADSWLSGQCHPPVNSVVQCWTEHVIQSSKYLNK